MKKNIEQAAALQLSQKEMSTAALMEFSASTMMVVMSGSLRSKKPFSSPAPPPAW
jgi:hypothetical protein